MPPIVNPNGYQLGNKRVFIQLSPSPAQSVLYQGCLQIGEAQQDLGKVDPIYCPSSYSYNQWDIVDYKRSPQAMGTADVTQRASRDLRDVWWGLSEQKCNFNLYEKIACAGLPNDISAYDAIELYENCFFVSLTTPQSNPLSGSDNDAANLSGSLTFATRTRVLNLVMSERVDATVVGEVLDGFYYDSISCGICAPVSDGCQKCYMLTVNSGGSPGLSSQIVYTGNNWQTAATMDIPVLAALSANRMGAMGQYCVVVSQANNGHAYAAFSDIDVGTINWALVTSGYVSTKGPRAIWVKSPSQAYIAGAGGYIYSLTDPTVPVTVLTDGSVSTQQLNDIHGFADTVVAVGNSNALLYSLNAGSTFGTITGPAVGVNLSAVWVVNDNVWFVATGTGLLYYTQNQGRTWTQIVLPSLGAAPSINDIWFATGAVGFIACEGAGAAKVLTTIDCGHSWQLASNTNRRMKGIPTALRFNVVTACDANTVAVGGRKAVGGDGIIALAQ